MCWRLVLNDCGRCSLNHELVSIASIWVTRSPSQPKRHHWTAGPPRRVLRRCATTRTAPAARAPPCRARGAPAESRRRWPAGRCRLCAAQPREPAALPAPNLRRHFYAHKSTAAAKVRQHAPCQKMTSPLSPTSSSGAIVRLTCSSSGRNFCVGNQLAWSR
jgi:hypothetical protein